MTAIESWRPLSRDSVGYMRAAIIEAPGRAVIRLVERPQPAEGEIRVALEGCGLCASNLPIWEGRDWFTYPRELGAPGHEAWGRVDAVGEHLSPDLIGRRVALLSYRGFAEYDVALASHAVFLPHALDHQAVPAEPIGCAMNVMARSGVQPGQVVTIIGIGFLGALLTRLVVAAGATAIAVSRRPFARDVALGMGASVAVESNDSARVLREVQERTAHRGCDVVIEAVGQQWALDLATQLAAERGRIVIAGFHQDGARTIDMFQWNWRGLDVVNAHEREPAAYIRGMEEGVRAMADGRLDIGALLTHRFRLADLGDAFTAAVARPDGFLKAVVIP